MRCISRLFNRRDKGVDEIVKSGAIIIDVRTNSEYLSGRFPDSENIPLSKIASHINEFKEFNNYVLVCRSGNRSSQAIKILKTYGLNNLYNGGSWQSLS